MELKGFKINVILLRQNDGNMPSDYYDFSKYAQIGFGQTLNLDDTLDTMSIELVGLPFRKEFEPTSMFRIEIIQQFVEELETGYFIKTYDFALQEDNVEQPNLSEDLFTHNLVLVNPAIICQQRSVDNISVTYKLQDVNLECEPADVDYSSNIKFAHDNVNYPDSFLPDDDRDFGVSQIDFHTYYVNYAYRYLWVYPTIYYPAGVISESNRATELLSYTPVELNGIKQNYIYNPNYNDGDTFVIDGNTYTNKTFIEFTVPLIVVERGLERQYDTLGYLPTRVIVKDTNTITNSFTETVYDVYPSKYIEFSERVEIGIWEAFNPTAPMRCIYDNELANYCIVAQESYNEDVLVNNRVKNRTIRIDFVANENHRIDIHIQRLPLAQIGMNVGGVSYKRCPTSNPMVIYSDTKVAFFTQQHIYTRLEDNYDMSIDLSFSYFAYDDNTRALFKQAKQVDAYYLFKKSQLATMPFLKVSGTAYYDTDLPFFVSESDKTLLERTKLIESDYVGKNLWEVFTEIGKYIHAKPRISIETDNNYNMTGRYLVSFLKYGNPNINTMLGTNDSIFNSRFAQEYIAELDSYVENYFNLGSYVSEYLHTSSTSEDELIYNDVVKLITKYPILEILNLKIWNGIEVSDGKPVWRDITKYIFEWNIYKTLDYDENKVPSKHRAIYYHLGTNIIEGMQFVTPKSSGVECAYSMKNIIGVVYNLSPDNVQVNHYVFHLDYRVKDNVRVSITRPDIRKYLLNSDYDYYPLHTQFNQQQDKIVSSDSFGLNAYGKLIRTGNSTYEYYNWTNDINNTVNEGDLYQTVDGLYYVSKVNRFYYTEHIEERIELTKDFNRLAQIIGIPSQPRFYEISERNIINRDVKFNEYVQIEACSSSDVVVDGIIPYNAYVSLNAMLNAKNFLADGVITYFKGDKDKTYDLDSNNMVYQTYTPLVSYSSKNTLTLEWDMEDNYSAGDKAVETNKTLDWSLNLFSLLNSILGTTYTQAYKTKEPTRYVDTYGRADLVDFLFTKGYVFTAPAIMELPHYDSVDYHLMDLRTRVFGGSNDEAVRLIRSNDSNGLDEILANDKGYILAKDNREKISFNYNIQYLLDSDRTILGDKLWLRDLENPNVKIVLLDQELSKFNADLINQENIFAYSNEIQLRYWDSGTQEWVYDFDNFLKGTGVPNVAWENYFDIENNCNFTIDELKQAKAFAVIRTDLINNSSYRLIIGRNVSDLAYHKKIVNFYFKQFKKQDCITNRKQLNNVYDDLYN